MGWQLVVLLSMVCLAYGFDFTKRCLLYRDRCVTHCPRDMHPYHTRCDLDTVSQKTCVDPEYVSLGYTCGWSRCDCNGDMLLDTNGICVRPAECPKSHSKKQRSSRRHSSHGLKYPHKLPTKIRFDDRKTEDPLTAN